MSGAIVFWSLQPTPYQALLEALETKGYGRVCPTCGRISPPWRMPSSPTMARRTRPSSAARAQAERRGVGRDRAGHAAERLHHQLRRQGGRRPVKADFGYADECKLTEEFLKLKARLTTSAVSQALAAVLERMDGMRA